MRNYTQSNLSSLKNSPPFQEKILYQPEKEYLLDLLMDLDGIHQNSKYHPEIDTLYHSLQVFQWAVSETQNPFLRSAALFHDIGKAIDIKHHATIGAEMLRGILCEPIPWLIEHHLDLLLHNKRTRKKLNNTQKLSQLKSLQRWDLRGRQTQIEVISPALAINIISQTDEIFQSNQ